MEQGVMTCSLGDKLMQNEQRIKIAIQKQGRLSNESLALLTECGLAFNQKNNALVRPCENLPIDILFIRDDDIPTLVQEGVCQLGIVGENVLIENSRSRQCAILQRLGFGQCRLSIAVPEEFQFNNVLDLNNICIATSYPNILREFCRKNQLNVEIITLSGSVEIAPRLGMADAIFDLVATGRTLQENGLREVICVLNSEAILVARSNQEIDYANY